MQVICGDDLRILSANARYPGSVHDSHVFESSRVKLQVQQLHNQNSNTWLWGDSAYAIKPYMIVPFRLPRTNQQRQFNKIHKIVRHKIERCFGVLKGRWRSLTKARALNYTHENAFYIIYSAIVCHNFLIAHNVPILNSELYEEEPDYNQHIPNRGVEDDEGRQMLMNYILENNIHY